MQRDAGKTVLFFVLPGVFNEIERLTTPENAQSTQDEQQMQTILQSIGDYNKCCCAEHRKEQEK